MPPCALHHSANAVIEPSMPAVGTGTGPVRSEMTPMRILSAETPGVGVAGAAGAPPAAGPHGDASVPNFVAALLPPPPLLDDWLLLCDPVDPPAVSTPLPLPERRVPHAAASKAS